MSGRAARACGDWYCDVRQRMSPSPVILPPRHRHDHARLVLHRVCCDLRRAPRRASRRRRSRSASPRRTGATRSTVEVREGGLFYSVQRDGRSCSCPRGWASSFGARRRFATACASPARRERRSTRRGRSRGARSRGCATSTTSCRSPSARRRRPAAGSPSSFRVFDDGVGFRYELPDQPGARRLRDLATSSPSSPSPTTRARGGSRRTGRGSTARSSSTRRRPVSTLDSVQTPLTMEMRERRRSS